MTVEDYLKDKNAVGVQLFRSFERLVEACGPAEVAVSRTVVFFKRKRTFAGAFVSGNRLEVVIDLLREVDHPCLIGAFRSTQKVISHRLRIAEAGHLDDSVVRLLAEAYADVGPGTR